MFEERCVSLVVTRLLESLTDSSILVEADKLIVRQVKQNGSAS